MKKEKTKIIVSGGSLMRWPLGGYTWQYLHYLVGLKKLGFDPYFYEDDWDFSANGYNSYYNPKTNRTSKKPTAGIKFMKDLFSKYGFKNRWVFFDKSENKIYGMNRPEFDRLFKEAEIIINLAGVCKPSTKHIKTKIFVDFDPIITQINLEKNLPSFKKLVSEYDFYFTFGENIGKKECQVPLAGLKWLPTRQPVSLELWKFITPQKDSRLTTIGIWNSEGRDVTYNGKKYTWKKRLEWLKFLEIPKLTCEKFEMAMDIEKKSADFYLLKNSSWNISDPRLISSNHLNYQKFIQNSKGEFSVAKDINIRFKSGWFSDRSACYLAAGRPVVLQDTGFNKILPTGKGLFSFSSLDEAVSAIKEINKNYGYHCKEARKIAEKYFDSDKVLGKMLKDCNI